MRFNFRNTKVSTRLAGVLTAVILTMVAASTYSVAYLFHAGELIEGITTREWVGMRTAVEWNQAVAGRIIRIQVLARLGVGDFAEKLRKEAIDLARAESELEQRVGQSLTAVQEVAEFNASQQIKTRFNAVDAKLGELNRAGDYDKLEAMVSTEFTKVAADYTKSIQTIESLVRARVERTSHDAKSGTRGAAAVAVSLVLASVVMAIGMGLWLSRSVSRPLNAMVDSAKTVASGDLSREQTVTEGGEAGDLQVAMKHMQMSLLDMVRQVRVSVDSITTASTEIAAGNRDLSSRTDNTAHSLEQAVSTVEELAATVHKTAELATVANHLAQTAMLSAERGGETMSSVVATMQEIRQSSDKITEIIGVIDGIAFQTNVLALNAAVEAARAGDHGRGFAVVAGEVRGLAQRSAEAAKEVKRLIASSVVKVALGDKLINDAGTATNEIVSAIREVFSVSEQISSATATQNAGIAEVGRTIAGIERATQQNAALVEQSAAASASLSDQAMRLAGTVSFFKLREDAGDLA